MQSISQDASGNNAQHRIAALLVKRSKARGMLGQWDDALKDADQTIKMAPSSPWGYERRHAALHGLRRYDEAIDAYSHMYSLIEASSDEEIRRQGQSASAKNGILTCIPELAKKYIAPSLLVTSIDDIVHKVSMTSPLVLIDVESGRLCNASERLDTFKLESQFKELLSFMMEELDGRRIQQVVDEYFRYVTLSHTWHESEPSYQDVRATGSVWELNPSPMNDKLRKFCEVVRGNRYRWAWCDTCCIDKTVSTVVTQSVVMMYKWYEASAATFVFMADVPTPSAPGSLKDSRWLTRSWTLLELLASLVVQFYTRDWQPYLDETRFNHKESPEIIQELAAAMDVTPNTITTFDPDHLSIREKLQLASKRKASREEDVAYSLIGIFKSNIQPQYGEGGAALGHLLEDIVARSGDLTVLDWTGKSSSYNSCLPATLSVYSQQPRPSPLINDAEMNTRVASLRTSSSREDVMLIYRQVSRLPPARFAHRRLYLPCIIFPVRKLEILRNSLDLFSRMRRYRAEVSMIGQVDFRAPNMLSITEPDRLIFVHPWIRDLCDRFDGSACRSTANGDSDDYIQALQLLVRLQQPFYALLLQQEANGDFKRVTAKRAIIVKGAQISSEFARDIETRVLEIL